MYSLHKIDTVEIRTFHLRNYTNILQIQKLQLYFFYSLTDKVELYLTV
jgi:hypothetical protein